MGETVLGRKVGNKAPLWGAVAGTIPDLDIFVGSFVSESVQLGVHRGISHSLTFAILGGAGVGWLLARLHHRTGATWKEWGYLAFWAFITHSLLDAFTSYGTQLFQPFSDYPVAFSTIFIIDPLYTLPLLFCLLPALFLDRSSIRRRRLNYLGLTLSSLYLLLTAANKLHVESAFTGSLREQGIVHTRLFTTPTPLNNLLWNGIAEAGDRLWVGQYSLLDDNRRIVFQPIDRNSERLQGLLDQEPVQKLLWFSRGYYTVTAEDGDLYFNDLRFGRADNWLGDSGDYVFSFRLLRDPDDSTRVLDFHQRPPTFVSDEELLDRFVARIKGQEPSASSSSAGPLRAF